MTITPETTAQATIVPLLGQINSANAGALEAQLLTLVDGGVRQLVLDFAALDYISSAGLRLVLVLAKRLKQERGAWCCAPCSPMCTRCSISAVSWPFWMCKPRARRPWRGCESGFPLRRIPAVMACVLTQERRDV